MGCSKVYIAFCKIVLLPDGLHRAFSYMRFYGLRTGLVQGLQNALYCLT